MPDGQRFSITVMVEGEARPVMTRAGSMIAEQWRRFGIDATTESAQAAFLTRRNGGDFEVGHLLERRDLGRPSRPQLLPRQLAFGVRQAGRRGADAAQLVALVESGARQDHRADPRDPFDDPKGVELGKEYVKLAVQEMPIIPLMSYNVFTMMDETYWTGYPTAADPYTNPVPNWGNSRYMMVRLKPRAVASRLRADVGPDQ